MWVISAGLLQRGYRMYAVRLNSPAMCLTWLFPWQTLPSPRPWVLEEDLYIDAQLSHTNSLLSKALVPVEVCISDIGENKREACQLLFRGTKYCNSLCLLTLAANYINYLWKEVTHIHVDDSVLSELCKWECKAGESALFPFDVSKRYDEIHRTKRLWCPFFHPCRTAGPRKSVAHRYAARKN